MENHALRGRVVLDSGSVGWEHHTLRSRVVVDGEFRVHLGLGIGVGEFADDIKLRAVVAQHHLHASTDHVGGQGCTFIVDGLGGEGRGGAAGTVGDGEGGRGDGDGVLEGDEQRGACDGRERRADGDFLVGGGGGGGAGALRADALVVDDLAECLHVLHVHGFLFLLFGHIVKF